jgi:integrase
MRLDTKTIAALALPSGKTEQVYWDSELRGFGLRLRQRGARVHRTWIAQYRAAGRTRKSTFGSAEIVLPAEARAAARKVLANVALGGDPQAERAAERQASMRTFRSVVTAYLEARERELRSSSYRVSKLYLTGSYFRPLHVVPASEITHADVAACIRTIERDRSAATAAAARRAVSTLFGWAIAEGLMGARPINPVIGTPRPADPTPRDRVLSNDELVAIWDATDGDDDYDHVIRLLALLGARASEVGGMRWSEIDLAAGTWHLPRERSKNCRSRSLVLPATVLAIIQTVPRRLGCDCLFGPRGHGFTRWSDAKRALDLRLAGRVKKWRVHDLRRTFATRLAEDIHVAPHVVEQALGHYRQTVATTYNRAIYAEEVTVALARWGEHVLALVDGRESKVVTLRA